MGNGHQQVVRECFAVVDGKLVQIPPEEVQRLTAGDSPVAAIGPSEETPQNGHQAVEEGPRPEPSPAAEVSKEVASYTIPTRRS